MAEGLSLGVNWILILSLAMFMSAENYGIISLIIAIESFLMPIMMFGQDRTILRFYRKNEFENVNVILISFIIVLFAFFLFFVAGFSNLSINYLHRINIDSFKFILMGSIFLLVLIKMYLAILRVEGNGSSYTTHRLGHQILRALFVLILVFVFNEAEYYVLASFLSSLLFVLLQSRGWIKRFKGVVNRIILKRMMLFGWPLIFHAMSAIGLTYIDRFMIEYFLGVSAVGNYSLAYMLGSGISLIYGLIAIYFEPFIYNKGVNSDSEIWLGIYTKISLILVSLGGVATLAISAIMFKYFFDDGYNEAYEIVPLILVAHILNSIYFQSNYRLAVIEKTGAIATGSFIAVMLNIVLNLWLIPELGIKGAALATFFSYMLLSVYLYLLSCHKSALKIKEQKNFVLYLMVELLLLVSILIDTSYMYYVILLLLIALTSINIYSHDRKIIQKYILKNI